MRKLRLVAVTLLVLTSNAPAYAGGGHGGTSVVIGVGGFGCCFGGFGFGGFWPPFGWGYAPPPAWGYAPPAAWAGVPPAMAMSPPAPAAPTALAAPSAVSPSAAAPTAAEPVWYYCPATNGYYPYVSTCAVSWRTVPTTPPQSHLVHAPVHRTPAPRTPEQPPRGVADTPIEAFLHAIGGPHEHKGEPRVVAEFSNSSGQPCQELEQAIVVDGTHQRASAIVCKRADGHWVIAPQTVRAAKN